MTFLKGLGRGDEWRTIPVSGDFRVYTWVTRLEREVEPTKELIADLHRDRIAVAREMTPEQRMLAGGELFDEMVERMVAGIRMQFPDATPEEVDRHLEHRLAVTRRLENRRWTPTKS